MLNTQSESDCCASAQVKLRSARQMTTENVMSIIVPTVAETLTCESECIYHRFNVPFLRWCIGLRSKKQVTRTTLGELWFGVFKKHEELSEENEKIK